MEPLSSSTLIGLRKNDRDQRGEPYNNTITITTAATSYHIVPFSMSTFLHYLFRSLKESNFQSLLATASVQSVLKNIRNAAISEPPPYCWPASHPGRIDDHPQGLPQGGAENTRLAKLIHDSLG